MKALGEEKKYGEKKRGDDAMNKYTHAQLFFFFNAGEECSARRRNSLLGVDWVMKRTTPWDLVGESVCRRARARACAGLLHPGPAAADPDPSPAYP